MMITEEKQPAQRLPAGLSCFVLDLDGTLCRGDSILPGAAELLQKLRDAGRKIILLTNNSARSALSLLERLERMGLAVEGLELVTSATATIDYLHRHYPGQRVYLLGNNSVRHEFSKAGIPLDDLNPQVVVTALDNTLDYSRMTNICRFLEKGLPYITAHAEPYHLTAEGKLPDVGAIHAFIHAVTGRNPEVVIGKPQAEILTAALARAGARPGETLVVGDKLDSDVAAAVSAGAFGALVLTGVSTRDDLAQSVHKPCLVLRSLTELCAMLREAP